MRFSTASPLARRLIAANITSEEHLAEKANKQSHYHNLTDFLVSENFISSENLAKFCCTCFGTSYLDINLFDLTSIDDELKNQSLSKKHHAIPLKKHNRTLMLAMSDPTDIRAIEDFEFNTGLQVECVVAEIEYIKLALESIYDSHEELDVSEVDFKELGELEVEEDTDEDDSSDSSDAPIIVYINKILMDAIRKGASDLHFEPYEKAYRIRFRIDGVLKEVAHPPVALANKLSARIKVMSRLDIAEKRLPQDGRIKLKITKNKSIDFRVSSLPTLWGEKIVMRILDSSSAQLGIDVLGYEEAQKQLYLDALAQPQGMILVTGPTGSGKTVSLYTGLNILNTEERNISTAEDPVEINLEGVNQVQINTKAGLDFASALRSFLRQDPDIVMVGEIRDLETAEIAIKAAQTGHLVLSTLHTNSAPETLTRLLNMGVPAYNVASSVTLIIAQRLARRLCPECKEPEQLPKQTLLDTGFTEQQMPHIQLFKPIGCEKCTDGYKGRVGIYETMPITPNISKIIMEGGNSLDIANQAAQEGINNLRKSGLLKAANGITSLSEINRVTSF
ncbi:type IV-A pilus assembly ATPase PilB [Flocculibacter collagenilyticus]|uniref:type IV-A pilus assembly ATPase PilB n=1 Tax=Flocculibacter collagenilyticus TaxID=2744479 RepID=UPI0018F32E0A|nr:type IV-A pilus assembly ATPase PilB [Flocculibacter collagenilyticus]